MAIGCATSPSASPVPVATVEGTAHAGPTCPVVRAGDASCADRPVAGAIIIVTDVSGKEVARVTTDATGAFRIPLPRGEFVVRPQPVSGVLGTPGPVSVVVDSAANPPPIDLAYDTGIR
jgi:hypothetical protein